MYPRKRTNNPKNGKYSPIQHKGSGRNANMPVIKRKLSYIFSRKTYEYLSSKPYPHKYTLACFEINRIKFGCAFKAV